MSRLDEIKARLQERTYVVADQDWMIARISRLEEALKWISTDIQFVIPNHELELIKNKARTALEDDK